MQNLKDYITEAMKKHYIEIRISDIDGSDDKVESFMHTLEKDYKLKPKSYWWDDEQRDAYIEIDGEFTDKEVLKLYDSFKSELFVDNSDWHSKEKLEKWLKK